MATFSRAPTKTFSAAATITRHARVKLAADGRVSLATNLQTDIGVTAGYAHASDDPVGVDLSSLEGTARGIASLAIAIGDKIYGAAAGKIGKTDTNVPIGIALSAAAADGDVIEFVRRQI